MLVGGVFLRICFKGTFLDASFCLGSSFPLLARAFTASNAMRWPDEKAVVGCLGRRI